MSRPPAAEPDLALPVRDDLARAQAAVLADTGRPGTWWTGAQRIAIAEATRAARECAPCRAGQADREVLAPRGGVAPHDGRDDLPGPLVDAIHRLVTDPGRFAKSDFTALVDAGLVDDAAWVELVSVMAFVHAVDVFARALGRAPSPLPEPTPGEPSRRRPVSARLDGAWVPELAPGHPEWRELFGERESAAHISRALSLVPDEARRVQAFSEPHYIGVQHVSDPFYSPPGRRLERLQIELVAARVSALNECFY